MWINKKQHGKRKFKSGYERDVKGERIFVLTEVNPPADSTAVKQLNKAMLEEHGYTFINLRRVTFESFQAAKALGWVKV